MSHLTQIEEQSISKWHTAVYLSGDGSEYDIIFSTQYSHNIGFLDRELCSVQLEGVDIPSTDAIWLEIEKAVKEW